MQWLTDNGRLLWYFAPEHLFVTQRARWPFVNSNNLAHALTIPLFIAWQQLAHSVSTLQYHAGGNLKKGLADFFSGRTFQQGITSIIWRGSLLIFIVLALLATLSRGAITACAVGAILYFLLTLLLIPPVAAAAHQHQVKKSSRLIAAALWGSFISGIIALFAFGTGGELLAGRIGRGLQAEHQDLRLQLYRDTAPLISNDPVFGIGAGMWPLVYPSVRSEKLSGINPEHLHSDPYQLVVETGIIGLLLFLAIALYTIKQLACLIRSDDIEVKRTALSLCSGLTALLLASLVDFPFKIPLIFAQLAFYCGIIAATASQQHRSKSTHD
jgi:O-antigen ligase